MGGTVLLLLSQSTWRDSVRTILQNPGMLLKSFWHLCAFMLTNEFPLFLSWSITILVDTLRVIELHASTLTIHQQCGLFRTTFQSGTMRSASAWEKNQTLYITTMMGWLFFLQFEVYALPLLPRTSSSIRASPHKSFTIKPKEVELRGDPTVFSLAWLHALLFLQLVSRHQVHRYN